MNQMAFVIGAYAVGLPMLIWLVVGSVVAMRRAEKAVEQLNRSDS